MKIGVLGINHKTAHLQLRESLAKASLEIFSPTISHAPHSYVLLSTCNRTELYFHSQDLAETHSYFLHQLRAYIPESFEHHLYSYFSVDCLAHLCRVTAGLDSAIFGETEIQGQVKEAYTRQHQRMILPKELHFLFQKSLAIAKKIRNDFKLSPHMDSLEQQVLCRMQTMFDLMRPLPVLFIGASAINRKIFSHLQQAGIQDLVMCNRSHTQNANMGWEEHERWNQYPVVIVATKASSYLLQPKEAHQKQLKSPFLDQQLIFDLSMPRNVDPQVGKTPGVTLLNLEHFQSKKCESPTTVEQSIRHQALLHSLKFVR